eukprot:m.205918 g.205918  ORF g.205918 m.205918 type:complete len:228 (+) comp32931_c18_seq1:187-870(+)
MWCQLLVFLCVAGVASAQTPPSSSGNKKRDFPSPSSAPTNVPSTFPTLNLSCGNGTNSDDCVAEWDNGGIEVCERCLDQFDFRDRCQLCCDNCWPSPSPTQVPSSPTVSPTPCSDSPTLSCKSIFNEQWDDTFGAFCEEYGNGCAKFCGLCTTSPTSSSPTTSPTTCTDIEADCDALELEFGASFYGVYCITVPGQVDEVRCARTCGLCSVAPTSAPTQLPTPSPSP